MVEFGAEEVGEWDEAARAKIDDWGREVGGGGGHQKEREAWRKGRHEETTQGEGEEDLGPFRSHGSEGVVMVGTWGERPRG